MAAELYPLAILNEAVVSLRESITLLPVTHPDHSRSLDRLAAVLQNRFEQTGQVSDLDEAISVLQKVLAHRPDPDPDHARSVNNLALALQTRFDETGHLAVLDEAVLMHRGALSFLPSHNPNNDRARSLSNLSAALQNRSEKLGQLEDLDEAIVVYREALGLRPAPHPDNPILVNNLATALRDRFLKSGQSHDLDEAVALHRVVLGLLPDHPNRGIALCNLARSLRTRYGETDQHADLDEALSLLREALVVQPEPHPNRWHSLSELAAMLGQHFQFTQQLVDIEEAITLCRQALQTLPDDHPGVCIVSNTLAWRLLERFLWIAEFGDKNKEQLQDMVGEVMDTFRTAAHCKSARISERFAIAREWATISHDLSFLDGTALEAHETAISLLPHLAVLGLDVKSRREALASKTDGLARDAAACAIKEQKLEKAIELLEEGRAIFWSQALQLRTPVDELESSVPGLAQKFREVSRALEQGSFRDVSRNLAEPPEMGVLADREAIRYRQLNLEWLAMVEEVRSLDGFQEFLRAKSFAKLSAAADRGPVVILIASELTSECDALVMRHLQCPLHVSLPQMTFETAERLLKQIRTLPYSSLPLARGDTRHMKRVVRSGGDSDSIFRDVLGTLWMTVVHPILKSLNLEKSKTPPRLWWLPTGPFASLPIHAAGTYDPPESEWVGDYIISSYTPTLSALLTPPPCMAETLKVLAAIQPVTLGQDPLPFTIDELQKIERYVPDRCLIKFGIPGAPAHVDKVLSELPGAAITHFACHGLQDARNPLESALLLENDQLKVSQLMQLEMPNASLVFLSACQTAMVGDDLPDESIHLAATLLFCGFRGAVATLWSIDDRDGPRIADGFYRHLFSTTKDTPHAQLDMSEAARALHLAVGELREKLQADHTTSQFVRWLPFVHFGL